MTDEEAQQEALRFLNRLDDVDKATIIKSNIILADDMLMYVIHDCSPSNDDVVDEAEQKLREALPILKNNHPDMPSRIYLFVTLVNRIELGTDNCIVSLANVGVEDI